MSAEQCVVNICFIPVDGNAQKFFGFSEFLAGLALMVLAWTIGDALYRFRVRTAPIPLQGLTFIVVTAIGVLTLLTDLWRAEQWLVPKGDLLTPGTWQAILAGSFLFTFSTWTWFAFIRPPRYGRYNAERFAYTLYRIVLKGSSEELAAIADELAHSIPALVRHATDRGRLKNFGVVREEDQKRDPPKVERYANDLLLLIADKRLCRAIVGSSPGTAMSLFQAMAETKKYGIPVEVLGRNIVNEAITNRDSFLFHEAEGYQSGLLGYHRPLSHAMFSNYEMVETIGTLLDPDIRGNDRWDASQWVVYCRIVLLTFRGYVNEGYGGHSYSLYRAFNNIEQAAFDLYKLDGVPNISFDNDLLDRLRAVVDFIKAAIKALEEHGVPEQIVLRVRQQDIANQTFYDHVAKLIFEVIFAVSAVSSPRSQCWWIQHNSVWSRLFNSRKLNGPAGSIVKFKVRRLIYDEIAEMRRFANFKGAKLLAFSLNVMGLKSKGGDHDKDSRALQKAVLAWTRKNYVWLHRYNPQVAQACLVDGMTYDVEGQRLVRTYPAEGLRREPHYDHLELDPELSTDGGNR